MTESITTGAMEGDQTIRVGIWRDVAAGSGARSSNLYTPSKSPCSKSYFDCGVAHCSQALTILSW